MRVTAASVTAAPGERVSAAGGDASASASDDGGLAAGAAEAGAGAGAGAAAAGALGGAAALHDEMCRKLKTAVIQVALPDGRKREVHMVAVPRTPSPG
jgi:hypothetical protein